MSPACNQAYPSVRTLSCSLEVYMEDFSIKVEHKDLNRTLRSIEKRQYPFALAKALTSTAKDGQSAIVTRTKRAYTLKSKWTTRNIRVKAARKADVVNKRSAYSEVYTDKRIPYMPQHEPGDTKRPETSKMLAIPAHDLKKKRYRTARGVKSMYSPERLMQQAIRAGRIQKSAKRYGSWYAKGTTKQKNPFVIKSTKKGSPILVRRKTVKRLPLEYLWVFKKTAKIKPTWKFAVTIKKRASRTFDKHFRQAFRQAIATAR